MRRADASVALDALQTHAADAGVKGMIPIGRPFLDYVISALADAGVTDVCLVIGPEHQRIRDYYGGEVELERVRVHFATQAEPLGSADAVLAVESYADGEHILAVNSDNYYPVASLRALAELCAAGVSAFEPDELVRLGNIDATRVKNYAFVEVDDDGMLVRIVEKPDARTSPKLGPALLVGMNSWSLPPEIYRACRSIAPSRRGELDLPDAVQFARDQLGVPFHVLVSHEAVLDLSTRADIASVARLLSHVDPRL
jgi:dTDP-glucose pyrophosphorylase